MIAAPKALSLKMLRRSEAPTGSLEIGAYTSKRPRMLALLRNLRVDADSSSSATAPLPKPTCDQVPATANAKTTSTVHTHMAQMRMMLTP